MKKIIFYLMASVLLIPGAVAGIVEGLMDECEKGSMQWLYLNCREGYKVFVQDIDLLREPNISKGMISGYGSVTATTRK